MTRYDILIEDTSGNAYPIYNKLGYNPDDIAHSVTIKYPEFKLLHIFVSQKRNPYYK